MLGVVSWLIPRMTAKGVGVYLRDIVNQRGNVVELKAKKEEGNG